MRANAVLTTSASINGNATDSYPQDKVAYRIIPKYATNMNLEVYGFGTYGSSEFTKWVDIWDNTTEIGDPIWYFYKQSDGNWLIYNFNSKFNGTPSLLNLDYDADNSGNLYFDVTTSRYTFKITSNSDGTITIWSTTRANKVLDIEGAGTANKTWADLYDYNGTDAQKFYLVPLTNNVVFNANGGNVSTSGKTVKWGASYGTLPTPTRTGYIFSGWYTAASGGSQVTSSTVNNDFMTTTSGYTGTRNLYAHWSPISYNIAYNSNGGSGPIASQNVSYDTSTTVKSNSFTRTGYTFTGWNTKQNGSGTAYSANQSVKNLSSTNGATVTLYAQWTWHTSGDVVHKAGTFIVKIPTKISYTAMKIGKVNLATDYKINVAGDSDVTIKAGSSITLKDSYGNTLTATTYHDDTAYSASNRTTSADGYL